MVMHLRKNFARGILSADINDSATQVVLNPGHSLPTDAGTFPLVIWDQSTYPDPADDINLEVVLASYAGVANTFNIVRAQEDTSAVAHSSGDRIALHYTAGMSLNDLLNVDHGSTLGLDHDDHTQYHTDGRAAIWLAANHETTYTHADIALNTAHRNSDGSDHSIVGDNTIAIALNTAHRSSSGVDHSYINQDVSTVGSPSFVAVSLGVGELTAGSINRSSGTLTLEVGGIAELSITSTGAYIQDASYIGCVTHPNLIQLNAGGNGQVSITGGGELKVTGPITASNYTAANLLTACATNAGALDFSGVSKTLTVEDNAIVSQDYSSDASPIFATMRMVRWLLQPEQAILRKQIVPSENWLPLTGPKIRLLP